MLVVHLLAVAPGFAATVNPSNEDADAHGNVPTLSSLIQRAITTHPLVEEGKANLRAGDQAVKTAKWQYFPTPGVSYEKAFVDNDGYTTLAVLTGQELDTATLAAGPRQSPPELDRWDQGLLIGALAHSPSLKRADANVKVARAGVKERRSATRPEVYLQFQREFDDHRPDSRVQVGIRSQFGAGLSSFSGIAQAREAVSSALALRRSEELAIREQVRSDLATLDSYALRRPALEEALRTSEQVYASYERQFLTGSKSWLDVMNSARDLQSAQLQVAEVIAGELSVEWRLYVLSNPLPVDGDASRRRCWGDSVAVLSQRLETPVVVGQRCEEAGQKHQRYDFQCQHGATGDRDIDKVHRHLHANHGDK